MITRCLLLRDQTRTHIYLGISSPHPTHTLYVFLIASSTETGSKVVNYDVHEKIE